jgi:hypothetical protein
MPIYDLESSNNHFISRISKPILTKNNLYLYCEISGTGNVGNKPRITVVTSNYF